MRVFCPSCSEPINIADDLAGKTTTCPLCKAAFTAPSLFSSSAGVPATPPASAANTSSTYALAPSPAPAAPTSISPTPPPPAPPPTVTPPPPAPPTTGHARSIGFSISPEIIQWIAPAALVVCVLLTFFSWNGSYPGGHPVYTQSPWGALVGGMHYDRVGEKVLQMNPTKPPEGKVRLEDGVGVNLLMWLYMPLLFGTAALAIFFNLLQRLPLRIPANLAPFVPWRMLAVALLATLITGILGLQALRGFGLENTMRAKIKEQVKENIKLPEQPTDEDEKTAEIKEGLAFGALNIRQTCALRLVLFLQILAIVGALLTFVMTRRAERPAPRFEFMW